MARHAAAGLTLLWLLTLAGPASAHGLGAECRLVGQRVEVEAYYDDDSPAVNAKVAVRDSAQAVVAEGRTDAEGRWSCARPAAGRYEVTVDAGGGHRMKVPMTIPAETSRELSASAAEAPPTVERISEGPGREEFTRTPWLKLGIGLAVIGGLAVAFVISRRIG
jgi:nickel transport protein